MRPILSIVLLVNFVLILATVLVMLASERPDAMHRGGPPWAAPQSPGGTDVEVAWHHDYFARRLHRIAGFTFIILCIVHLACNRKCLWSYLQPRR